MPSPAIATQGLVAENRLREAVRILREAGPKGLTRKQFMAKLGNVSPRTVERTLRILEEQGAQINRERAGSPPLVCFALTKGPDWDEHVSPESRLALHLANLALSQSGTLVWKEKLKTIEDLVSAQMSAQDHKLFNTLVGAVRLQGMDDPIEAPDVVEPILKALGGSTWLELEYSSVRTREVQTIKVMPYALTLDIFSGGTFLLAWDHERKVPIHLRISRIDSATALPRIAVHPHPELMEQAATYQIGGWTSASRPFTVEVRIRGSHWVRALAEAPPALPDFETFPDDDRKAIKVRFKANDHHGVCRWIMQFGEDAEALEPAEIRGEVARQLKNGLALYQ